MGKWLQLLSRETLEQVSCCQICRIAAQVSWRIAQGKVGCAWYHCVTFDKEVI